MAYKANKSTNLTGFSVIDEVRAVSMAANIKNEGNQSYGSTITILDPGVYNANAAECRADIQSFWKDVYAAENQLFKGGVAVE